MSIYDQFIGTVSQGISNPYGLAAVAATGKHESGYSERNAYGQWSDPAESGSPGQAGGILSWRNERLANLRRFASARGDNPNRPSPQTQGEFFLQEDPALVQRLNSAGSIDEAQSLMNNAWRFAGYNRPGGEAARRRSTAANYLSNISNGELSAGPAEYTAPVQGGSYMAGYPSTTGGLGGLGGIPMPQEERGFGRQDIGDMLQAVGMSLMSSPRNAPLQGFGQAYTGISDRRERREESQADRQAFAGVLGMAGLPQDQALAMARNPAAAAAALGIMKDRRTEQMNLANANKTIAWLDTVDPEMAEFARSNPSMVGEAAKEAIRRQRDGSDQYRMLAPEEAQQYGLDPTKAYQVGPDNRITSVGGSGQTINVNTGNSNKFREKSDEAAATRINDIITEGNSAPQLLGDIQQLASLGGTIGTGKEAQVKAFLGPYAEAAGISIDGLGEMQAFDAIVSRVAPQMRPAGSGATSDFDARQFLKSLPSLGNTPGGNQIITDTFQAVQQNKMQAAEIASLSMRTPEEGGISWQEAEQRIRALPNPYERYQEFVKQREQNNNRSPDDLPKPSSKAEYDALPPGAIFLDPQGKQRRKP